MQNLAKENNLLKDLVKTLEKENQSRNNERAILNQQLNRLTLQNQQLIAKLKQSGNGESLRLKSIISQLEGEIVRLKENAKKGESNYDHQRELTLLQQRYKNQISQNQKKIIELQNQNRILRNQKKLLENSRTQLHRLQLRIKQKDSLIATLEQEKQTKTISTPELKMKENQIKRLSNTVENLRESMMQMEFNMKERQMQLNELEIQKSKLEEKLTEKLSKQKDETKRITKAHELQTKKLHTIIMKLQQQKQINNTQGEEITSIRKQNQYLNRLINTLKEDNHNIKQTVSYQKERISELEVSQHEIEYGGDLRSMVIGLRDELNDMKLSYKRMNDQNEKMKSVLSYQSSFKSPRHQMNMGEHFMGRKSKYLPYEGSQWGRKSQHYDNSYEVPSSNYSSIKSPSYKSKLDQQIVNREKWENLQKKINMLRQENDDLKKTLFD